MAYRHPKIKLWTSNAKIQAAKTVERVGFRHHQFSINIIKNFACHEYQKWFCKYFLGRVLKYRRI